MRELFARLIADEGGQDLIEYALLAGFLGFAAVVGVGVLGTAMNTTYTSWDNAVQDDSLVNVREPQ